MAGTLCLLRQAGHETHYLNLANGSCGGALHSAARLRAIRRREGQAAARILGATFHPSLVDDLDVYYDRPTLRKLAAIIREVSPRIVLAPSPQDYMEDHTNTCRLAVTAAFVCGMRNFITTPRLPPAAGELTVYHAMPHGLRGPLRERVVPGIFVNTAGVHKTKTVALAAHASQQEWLNSSQRMDGPLQTMERFSREVGAMSGRFEHAEGWRRRLHYGFCAEKADPLREALGRSCVINPDYEAALEAGGPRTETPPAATAAR